ncbi:MAG: class I SAM-dependent methyltransferase [bacterium]
MNADELRFVEHNEENHFYFRTKRKILQYMYDKHIAGEIDGPQILDLSCSTATDMKLFDNVTGMDIDFQSLVIAKRINMPLVNGDANRLPFRDNSFDIILAVDLISVEGIDEKSVLSEIERVLRPGGYLYINVPAMKKLYSRHDRTVGNRKRYDRKEIKSLFASKKWNMIECSYWSFFVLPLVFIRRKLISPVIGRDYRSDLVEIPFVLNTVLKAVYSAELNLFKISLLPAGISLFALLKYNEE